MIFINYVSDIYISLSFISNKILEILIIEKHFIIRIILIQLYHQIFNFTINMRKNFKIIIFQDKKNEFNDINNYFIINNNLFIMI